MVSTTLQNVGTSGKTLAIFGDGFAEGEDQTSYNRYVDAEIMRGVFLHDTFNEDIASWNIIRVNLESNTSGVSTRNWNLRGTPADKSDDSSTDNIVDTAFNIISNGEWWYNWFEDGDGTATRLATARAAWAPTADFVLIVVNSPRRGGQRRGDVMKVTIRESAAVIAHEFGHAFANLADEYSSRGRGDFGLSPEPARVNVTRETKRSKIKWRQFIAPGTPVPTGTGANSGYTAPEKPATWDNQTDAGLFEGAATFETGVHRPVVNCRMRSNADKFCPVCYSEMKDQHHDATGRTFLTTVPGRFTGTESSEFFGVSPRGLSLYRADDGRWEHVRSTADRIRGRGMGWRIRPGDVYVAGDFDGDGRDELVVYNSTWWKVPLLGLLKVGDDGSLRLERRYDKDIPGWGLFEKADRFLVGDFDGDGRDDLLVTNFTDWCMPYVATLISTGSGFKLTRRYDLHIPGWGGMRRRDKILIGDFEGTGRSDVLIWNAEDWGSNIYLGLFRMQNDGRLNCIRRYTANDLPGWGGFRKHDRLYIGDFNGDGRDDLYLFNGEDWSKSYLGMFRSTGRKFSYENRYDDDVPGWGGLRKHDQFLPADLVGDGRVGLFVWNMTDWRSKYVGRIRSTGTALVVDRSKNNVGEWHLDPADQFTVVPPNTGDPDRVIVHNRDWLGTICTTKPFKPANPLTLGSIYNRWVHNYRHGRNWLKGAGG